MQNCVGRDLVVMAVVTRRLFEVARWVPTRPQRGPVGYGRAETGNCSREFDSPELGLRNGLPGLFFRRPFFLNPFGVRPGRVCRSLYGSNAFGSALRLAFVLLLCLVFLGFKEAV